MIEKHHPTPESRTVRSAADTYRDRVDKTIGSHPIGTWDLMHWLQTPRSVDGSTRPTATGDSSPASMSHHRTNRLITQKDTLRAMEQAPAVTCVDVAVIPQPEVHVIPHRIPECILGEGAPFDLRRVARRPLSWPAKWSGEGRPSSAAMTTAWPPCRRRTSQMRPAGRSSSGVGSLSTSRTMWTPLRPRADGATLWRAEEGGSSPTASSWQRVVATRCGANVRSVLGHDAFSLPGAHRAVCWADRTFPPSGCGGPH